jgi:hypothetical protein
MKPASLQYKMEMAQGRTFTRCDLCLQRFPEVVMYARGFRAITSGRGGFKSIWGQDMLSLNFCDDCVDKMYKEVCSKRRQPVRDDGVAGLDYYLDT